MAFTERELEISNKSYTNKDFAAIYEELLTIAEKISNRFSPTSAVESDPFIVLLKLAAFVTDKVNYNIDKNILERFISSCTQVESMRELTETLGYPMHYYIAAQTSVVCSYKKPEELLDDIQIPRGTVIESASKIPYVTLENATIFKTSNTSAAINVIQGKIQQLLILGNTSIQLENLTNNHRLYFPELMVAENGVIVTNSLYSSAWNKVDNLNVQPYGDPCYKFSFDSKRNLPYIEFPDWIAEIIGDGLNVEYIVTQGETGNVAAKELNTIKKRTITDINGQIIDDGYDNANIRVVNLSAASSGTNPETIDQSYIGFKKMIGTFDTLITCRDYANAIYNMLTVYGNRYVSNVQVADRRTDINYACDVITCSSQADPVIIPMPINEEEPQAVEVEEVLLTIDESYEDGDVLQYKIDISKYISIKIYTYNAGSETLVGEPVEILNGINYTVSLPNYLGSEITIDWAGSDGYYIRAGTDIAGIATYKWVIKGRRETSINIVKPSMTPFDLTVYAFNPITNTTYSAIKSNTDGYNNSFRMLSQTKINEITSRLELDTNLYKNMCHTYKELADEDITSIQNYYEITATISTIAKVNTLEQTDIIANIYSALTKEFNPSNLNFGYEIPFDELIRVMENADKRIKLVSLQEPIQTPKIVTRDGVEHDMHEEPEPGFWTDTDEFRFIVAKNVLAGRAPLYEYYTDFVYDYSYSNLTKIEDIHKITTVCDIGTLSADHSYILNENEVVQFLAPNFITEYIYGASVYYYLELASGTSIEADIDYELKAGDTLLLYYEKNGRWVSDFIQPGKIINSNAILYTDGEHGERNAGKTPNIGGITYNMYALNSGEQLAVKKINSEKLTLQKKCYWITNESDNKIIWDATSYILKENEYFFYSDPDLTSLYAFGSGTKLMCTIDMTSWDWTCEADINIDDITLEGLYALNDAFNVITFTNTNNLTITENEIITLTAGDTIHVKNDSINLSIPNNNFTGDIGEAKIEYKYGESKFTDLPDRLYITDANWSCRALLDINCGPDLEQLLVENQKIYYTLANNIIDIEDPSTSYLQENDILKFNILVQRSGGENINLGYITINNLEEEIYPTMLQIKKATDCQLKPLANGLYSAEFEEEENTAKFYAADIGSATVYMMIYVTGSAEGMLPTLQAFAIDDDSEGSFTGTPIGDATKLIEGINVIPISPGISIDYYILEKTINNETFLISPIKYTKGLNPYLGIIDTGNFYLYLSTNFSEQEAKFYPLADLDPSKEIELSEIVKLDTAQAFYDSNNIANKWVLPKIDFSADKIHITIARNSMK